MERTNFISFKGLARNDSTANTKLAKIGVEDWVTENYLSNNNIIGITPNGVKINGYSTCAY